MSGPPDRRLAVALRYEGQGAPRVVAAGAGAVGERIIAAAQVHGVPLKRDPALAQALSRIELDTEIPHELYTAVAEILAFLTRAGVSPSDAG